MPRDRRRGPSRRKQNRAGAHSPSTAAAVHPGQIELSEQRIILEKVLVRLADMEAIQKRQADQITVLLASMQPVEPDANLGSYPFQPGGMPVDDGSSFIGLYDAPNSNLKVSPISSEQLINILEQRHMKIAVIEFMYTHGPNGSVFPPSDRTALIGGSSPC